METQETAINGNVIQRMVYDYDNQRVERWEIVANVLTLVDDRVMTASEVTDQNAEINERSVYQRIREALESNKDFLAIGSPSNAQAVEQLRALTRQVSALLRLQMRNFDAS